MFFGVYRFIAIKRYLSLIGPRYWILVSGYWISIGNHAFFSQHPGSSIQHHLMYSDSREVRVKNDDPKIVFLNSIVPFL